MNAKPPTPPAAASGSPGQDALLDSLKRVTIELRSARERLRKAEEHQAEPIAVIGMGCRFPGGVSTPRDLWELVRDGRDAIAGFPDDRGWPLERLLGSEGDLGETIAASEGGFLDAAGEFDASFFGVRPPEALAMDPQLRQLLETAWEACEDAGVDPERLKGTRTGVFAGSIYHHYGIGVDNPGGFTPPDGVGSLVSGFVAYNFGLEGPAVGIDTACSSSLVAIHLACQSLLSGDSTLALAGGVSVILTPNPIAEYSRQRGLASDGRCKAFSAAADGMGWAEGAGMVLLERLADAERNGHRPLAVIRGSAINQDGASNGISAPNGPAQERVIRRALETAGLSAGEVDAVEAHGTGTVLGDPIEARALLATYGQERGGAEPVRVGSLKSNIGHTQAAAGVAGLIKTVQALRNELLPRSLYAEEPTPHVDWEAGELELLAEARPWPRGDRPRRAGVSSFGASGTNAHLILEEAPAPATDEAGGPAGAELPAATPLPLAAKTPEALAAAAGRLAEHLRKHPELELGEAARTLAKRPRFAHRAVVAASDREAALSALGVVARGEECDNAARGAAAASALDKGPVFLFPGHGSQWPRMALGLLEESPLFAARIDECEEALAPHLEWSLRDVLRCREGAPSLERVDVAQPVLFAMAAALTALWRSWGVEPAAVLGHSQGEIAAAHAAGALDLDDAARLVALRSQVLMEGAGGSGRMALAATDPEQLAARVPGWEELVSLAAINGPSTLVLSGGTEALEEVLRRCTEAGIWTRLIRGADAAGHSPAIAPLRQELLALAAPLRPRAAATPFYSSVTGDRLDSARLDAEYWYRNARETVRFAPTVERLLDAGFERFVEVSPNPLLEAPLGDMFSRRKQGGARISGTLRREQGGLADFLHGLGAAWAGGVGVDWESSLPVAAEPAPLPTYPFQRSHYWLRGGAAGGDAAAIGQESAGHPLLGAVVRAATEERLLFTGRLSLETQPWLRGHGGMGVVLAPGTAFIELALYAGREVGCDLLEELTLEAPLLLPRRGGVQVQLSVGAPEEDGSRRFQFHARAETAADGGAGEWARHGSGVLAQAAGSEDPEAGFAAAWPPPGAEALDLDGFYDELAEIGIEYGASFRNVRAVWLLGECLYAEVGLAAAEEAAASSYGVHPALLDAAIHSVAAVTRAGGVEAELEAALPFSFSGVSLRRSGATALRVMVQRQGERELSLRLADEGGAPLGAIAAIVSRPMPSELLAAGAGSEEALFTLDWLPAPAAADEGAVALAVLGEPDAAAALGLPDVPVHRDAAALADALEGAESAPPVALFPLPTGADVPALAHECCRAALAAAQEWLGEERLAGARLVFVSTAAVEARPGEGVSALGQAPVWGLVRAAQAEHPGRFGLVDLDGEEASSAALATALTADEPQLVLRGGELLVARLRAAAGGEELAAPTYDPEGTVLVTGGSGDLAGVVARHLVSAHGIRRLLLASRSGDAKPGSAELRNELEAMGATVEIAACDVGKREQLAELLGAIDPAHPLTAVFHTAAVLDDGLLADQTPERFATVLAAKADAAWHLHELTAEHDLAAFVLFSSLSGVVGYPGQSNYDAANCFLDALAAQRRAAGSKASSIAWGIWERTAQRGAGSAGELGMARLMAAGFPPIGDAQGMELLDAAVAMSRAAIAAAPTKRGVWRALARLETLPPVLAELVPAGAGEEDLERVELLARRLAAVPAPEREEAVLEFVREQVAAVLVRDPAEVDLDTPFLELGLDSLGALYMRNRLNAATGLDLTPGVAFDHPTPRALAAYLAGQVAVDAAAAPPAPTAVLTALLRTAHEQGRTREFLSQLHVMSSFRPRFESLPGDAEPFRLRLARGPAPTVLACVPSITPISGPHEYAGLARQLGEERDVYSLRWPGFTEIERLPATPRLAAELQAEAILAASDGAPFVVLGHSTGGVLAHAAAQHLQRLGSPPAAVVLIDSYHPSQTMSIVDGDATALGLGIFDAMLAAPEAGVAIDDVRLTAMAAYVQLVAAVETEPIEAPLLLLRASEPLGGDAGGEWRARWEFEPDVIDVPGNHLTMMSEHVESTARAISEWLAATVLDDFAGQANQGSEVLR